MNRIPFDESELQVVGEMPGRNGPPLPVWNVPVSPRENMIAAYQKEPCYQPAFHDVRIFCPKVIPDNVARGFLAEAQPAPEAEFGGPDMFGIEWEYVPVAGGSMVRPGNPLMSDANEWHDKLVWPDIESWDWEGSARENDDVYLKEDRFNMVWILNGAWFERLVSFMNFENAAVALIDEEQTDAVKALFEKTTGLMNRIIDRICKTYRNIDGICVHDDWGSQYAPFFSEQVARELFLPFMKTTVDCIHANGKFADLHSCGHIEDRIGCIVEAGWDSWSPMPMNDTQELYRKYGDRILLGVNPDPFSGDAPEEDIRAAARGYAEQFCCPGKPSQISMYGTDAMHPVYRETLYRLSRRQYLVS